MQLEANLSPLREIDAVPLSAAQAKSTETPVLLRYWQLLLRWRLFVAAIIGACLLLGAIFTLLQTPEFAAKARIEIRRSQDNVTDVKSVTPEDSDQDLEFYQTQYALLQSRSLAARVVRRLQLANSDHFFEIFHVKLDGEAGSHGPGLSRAQVEERNRKAVDVLLDHIGISPIRGSALVDVSFASSDPALAKSVANAWVEEFIQSNLDRRYASSQAARDFLETRLEDLRQKLEESERNLVNYASHSGIVALSNIQQPNGQTETGRTLTIADIEALNTELATATGDRIQAQSRLHHGVDQALIDNQMVGTLRERRDELKAEYSKESSQFDDKYPPLLALSAQITEIDAAIAHEEARIRDSVETAYRQAVQREDDLRDKIAALKSNLVAERQDSIQYNIFQREVDTNRELYEALLQRYKEIGVAGVGTNNISVVDPAETPHDPSSPSLPIDLLIALVAGLALAGGFVVVVEQVDQSLRNPTDVKVLGLPLLGVIPKEKGGEIVEHLADRKSPVGEAYLAAQTNLSFLTDHGVPDSIMFTSTRAGEGKSTSAAVLAIMLARTGNRTVIVDADIRNPSLSGLFNLADTVGLSNYLSGQQRLDSLVQQTKERNLQAISAGPPPPNPAELLSNKKFGELIRELKREFDTVIVDGPPVLGLADVPLISRCVDGVIYTIEANGVKIGGIRNALDRLHMASVNIFGALVTKYAASDDSSYGYGYDYAYTYGYGRRDGATADS